MCAFRGCSLQLRCGLTLVLLSTGLVGTAFLLPSSLPALSRLPGASKGLDKYCNPAHTSHHTFGVALSGQRRPSHFDPDALYLLKELASHDLLTFEEEIALGRCMVQWKLYCEKAKELTAEINRMPSPTEWAAAMNVTPITLARTYKLAKDARQAMIDQNMKLVVHIAKFYQRRGLRLQDLIQEGCFGLMKAVDKYDPEKGFRFSTYASWWIKQAVSRACAEKSRTVRLPVHIHDLVTSVKRIERDIMARNGGQLPSSNEIAERLGLPSKKVALLRSRVRGVTSLDQAVYGSAGSRNEASMKDHIKDDKLGPGEKTEDLNATSDLSDVMSHLSSRELEVLKLRYGLDSDEPMTLEQIGKKFQVTRERVRQIEARALSKLRSPSKAKELESVLSGKEENVDDRFRNI